MHFHVSLTLLAAISASVLTTAAPLPRANSQDLFSSACDSAGLAGQLTGVAITALDNIQSNDQAVSEQLDELKSILAAVDTAGSQVGAQCQAAGLGLNSNNASSANGNNAASSGSTTTNAAASQKTQSN
ncbi:hypothetical protein FB45DRAFT_926920 [Roridomyces roridus]|uniref:Uncharacterized protein n=1 Tax=Roridomyces roridus TaxID=1738132 RepID=A0AAD7BIK5_9AGAR|nr:hypothetical protein FB45DRAFT_926920 [Roridomyces roridus]